MEFLNHFFGQFTAGEYIAFILFALIGNFIVKLIHYMKKKAEKRATGEHLKFNLWYSINDNILDFILAFICSFLAFRFFPDTLQFLRTFTPIGEYEEKMFYGLLLGLGFQYLLHVWMNRVTLDLTIDKIRGK